MVEGITGNQPSFTTMKIQGGTVAKDEGTISIANSIKADILKGTSQGLQDAASKIMDLWLENADNKINAVLTVLQDELPAETFRQFNDQYVQPSINVMSKISGGSKVAEQFDYSVSVKSAQNLSNLGVKFSESRGTLGVSFAAGVQIEFDGETFGSEGVRLAFDNNTKGIAIVETDSGFELRIENLDGSIDIATLTTPSPKAPIESSGYTPGTRYAVVSKDEINYILSK